MTSNDLWPPPKMIGIFYSIWDIHWSSMRFIHVSLLETMCLQSFQTLTSGDHKWPLTSSKNNRDHLMNMGKSSCQVRDSSMLSSLRYHVYKVFRLWPLATAHDLWPPPKAIPSNYYRASMGEVWESFVFPLLRYCLQGFQIITFHDLKWPLTSTKNDRDLLLNMGHPLVKYEIHPCLPSWDNVFTKFSDFDLWWPQMTFDLHQKQ